MPFEHTILALVSGSAILLTMTNTDIALSAAAHPASDLATFETAGEVVAWFGAVQAQDYLGSLWASASACARRAKRCGAGDG